jgi:hypothetical protein
MGTYGMNTLSITPFVPFIKKLAWVKVKVIHVPPPVADVCWSSLPFHALLLLSLLL